MSGGECHVAVERAHKTQGIIGVPLADEVGYQITTSDALETRVLLMTNFVTCLLLS